MRCHCLAMATAISLQGFLEPAHTSRGNIPDLEGRNGCSKMTGSRMLMLDSGAFPVTAGAEKLKGGWTVVRSVEAKGPGALSHPVA